MRREHFEERVVGKLDYADGKMPRLIDPNVRPVPGPEQRRFTDALLIVAKQLPLYPPRR